MVCPIRFTCIIEGEMFLHIHRLENLLSPSTPNHIFPFLLRFRRFFSERATLSFIARHLRISKYRIRMHQNLRQVGPQNVGPHQYMAQRKRSRRNLHAKKNANAIPYHCSWLRNGLAEFSLFFVALLFLYLLCCV